MTAYPHDALIDLDYQQAAQDRCAEPPRRADELITVHRWLEARIEELQTASANALPSERLIYRYSLWAMEAYAQRVENQLRELAEAGGTS